jgi:hypothetical protein
VLDKIKNEPVMVAIVGFIAATIALLIAFGVHVTPDQREAIEAWVLAGVALAVAIRSLVSPTRKSNVNAITVSTKHVIPPPSPPPPASPVPPSPGATGK